MVERRKKAKKRVEKLTEEEDKCEAPTCRVHQASTSRSRLQPFILARNGMSISRERGGGGRREERGG